MKRYEGSHYRFTIGDKTYDIVNESSDSYSGFNHYSTIYYDYKKMYEHKSHYINRTWEAYRFQSCMRSVLEDFIDDESNKLIAKYKEDNHVSRLTKKKREEVDELINHNDFISGLKEVYKDVCKSHYTEGFDDKIKLVSW